LATLVVVVDGNDHPVANAAVFAVVDGRRRSRATTDEKGLASIAVPEKETTSLFVIPNEGAFIVFPMVRADGSRLTLHLLPATSSLRIRARTTEGKPMPPFSLLMRFNGDLMPLEIADELMAVQGLRLAMNETSEAFLRNIPAGRYEFWPYRTTEEVDSILAAGRDATPPIQVDVHSGENSIAVKFATR
jgi:hypothetical protein